MRIPGLKTAKKTVLWLRNRLFPGALILGYHRIADVAIDSFENCITPDHFAQQMEVIARFASPVNLENMIASLNGGNPHPRTVCVTIDDGYQDTLTTAKPILERYHIPATVFVTTGNLGKEFWWDKLERIVLDASGDIGPLQLEIKGQLLHWEFDNPDSSSRADLIRSLGNYLRPLDDSSRQELMDRIQSWSMIDNNLPSVRNMTPDELGSLVEGSLIQLGSHSVTHPVLTSQSEVDRRYEIEQSKRLLEQIIAGPVVGFSYPNGRFQDGDPELVAQSGYRYACMSLNGTVRADSDRYTLPRFWPGNVGGEPFRKWLHRWL